MIEEVSISTITAILGAIASYLFVKNDSKKQFKHYDAEAKAKALAIEHEAENHLHQAKVSIKEQEVSLEKKFQDRVLEVEKKKNELTIELKSLDKRELEIEKDKKSLLKKELYLDKLVDEKESELANLVSILEKSSSMTKDEAKVHLIQQVEEQSQLELAQLIRKYETQAKQDAKKKADYIISQAVTRYAGEFAGERLQNIVTLPSDEHKGRIIGKEGRNIKSLEQLLGVDIIIDETPGVIIISNFNLYRRAIATRTIELLVADGRIHPGRIEDVHAKVTAQFEQKILEDGENIVVELGLFPMAEELMRLLGRMRYRASYGQNALAHTLEVAKLASIMAAEMGGDDKLALRAGLLHDIGKALTQDVGGSHV
ncbi:MAG TPA: DUF3552 domain-containing protein, partial [Sulfurovum sp.]|nr:DUF3552 domain-containing protein [Sulfurovum sp.]